MHRALRSVRRTLACLVLFAAAACGGSEPIDDVRDGGRDGDVRDADGGEDLVCTGTATLCEARALDRCGLGAGCFEGGACEELPRTCTGLSVDVCGATPGCAWFDIVGRCGLAFLDCTRGDDRDGCTKIAGCAWAPRCEGAPLACDQISRGQCLDQDGCSLEERARLAR